MKPKTHLQSLTILIGLVGFSLLSGCAALGMKGEPSKEELELDPVAAVADHYRKANEDSEESQIEREAVALKVDVARHNGELAVGMAPSDVMEILGEPRDVETAGTPGMGFERWVYYDGLSTPWSLSTAHIVTFERGAVVSWRKVRR